MHLLQAQLTVWKAFFVVEEILTRMCVIMPFAQHALSESKK